MSTMNTENETLMEDILTEMIVLNDLQILLNDSDIKLEKMGMPKLGHTSSQYPTNDFNGLQDLHTHKQE